MNTFTRCLTVFCLLTGINVDLPTVVAHDELTEQQTQEYSADGTLDERKARIATLKQFRMAEGMRDRAVYKVRRAALEASGLTPAEAARALTSGPQMAFPFTSSAELGSTGTQRTLTILIDFKDHRATADLPGLTVAGIRENIYGTGTMTAQAFKPHESLHEYYRRASQDQVDVQGDVLGWHHFAKNRKDYEPVKAPATLPPQLRQQQQARNDNKAIFTMLSEALNAVDATHDFGQYDNDNDGDIDLVTILYAGPATDWGSFWWAYRWEFFVSEALSTKFDGKRAKQFVFQFVDTRGPADGDFDPTTLLHEMGHAFGLADYYDYDPDVGPTGGVGGLDMMHANQGNQNAFSRWLLDWIKPTVVGGGSPAVRSLNASCTTTNTNKAIAIFPGLIATGAPAQELFILENRHKLGNDANLPGNGLVIWHVDASVNSTGDDFEYDNSYTEHKLIKLMRADNANDFGRTERATAATYFTNGKSLTPTSTPSSRDHASNDTGIAIDQIGASGESIAVRIGFLPTSPIPAPPQAAAADTTETPQADDGPVSVESILESHDPINLDELEALDRQLATATTERLAELWSTVAGKTTKTDAFSRSAVLKLLLSRWASKDGASSAQAAMELSPEDPLRVESLPLIMNSWARNAPAEAARWYLDDQRQDLRERLPAGNTEFTHEAFEGLYVADPEAALQGIKKLSSTADIVDAVDGIIHSGTMLGDDTDTLNGRLRESESDVVKARLNVIEALRKAEESIKDPKQRTEFRKLLRD